MGNKKRKKIPDGILKTHNASTKVAAGWESLIRVSLSMLFLKLWASLIRFSLFM